tara:strand:- start:1589 stop:2359 length:771 start_codon:yes stop_codon:yes gene_type:complete
MNIPNKIFIVPYRNREFQKIHFEVYMKYILQDIPKEEYEIYFSHQCDPRPFNRGASKNIGFLAMKNKYPDHYKNITFIFNDLDTMPYEKNLLNYDTTIGTIKHYYGFNYALGGIFSIKGGDFEKCNGFPNLWGYGLEDNTMQKRAEINKITIDRSNFYPILDKHILQIHTGGKRMMSNKAPILKDIVHINSLQEISNLKYTIDNNMINISNFDIPNKFENNLFYYQDFNIDGKVVPNKQKQLEQIQKLKHFGMKLF